MEFVVAVIADQLASFLFSFSLVPRLIQDLSGAKFDATETLVFQGMPFSVCASQLALS